MNILPALQQDLPEILALQRAAFAAEAQLVNDWNIPPLTQTLEELAEDWRKGIMLKAQSGQGALVGTVRGHAAQDGFYIGRLAVLPQWQGKGVGSALLEAIIDQAHAQAQPKGKTEGKAQTQAQAHAQNPTEGHSQGHVQGHVSGQAEGYGQCLSGPARCVLFTSTKSERNLRLYERFGFRPFKKSTTATGVALVWLERV